MDAGVLTGCGADVTVGLDTAAEIEDLCDLLAICCTLGTEGLFVVGGADNDCVEEATEDGFREGIEDFVEIEVDASTMGLLMMGSCVFADGTLSVEDCTLGADGGRATTRTVSTDGLVIVGRAFAAVDTLGRFEPGGNGEDDAAAEAIFPCVEIIGRTGDAVAIDFDTVFDGVGFDDFGAPASTTVVADGADVGTVVCSGRIVRLDGES